MYSVDIKRKWKQEFFSRKGILKNKFLVMKKEKKHGF